MNVNPSQPGAPINSSPATTSELNNLLAIISGTSAALENIWQGNEASQKYFEMLRASVDRAAQVTSRLVVDAGGSNTKAQFHPERPSFIKRGTARTPAREKKRSSIIVVDDEPMALALNQEILSEAGFDVSTAQSGFECLELFRKQPHRFDLILLDLAMPLMDGEETFAHLQSIRPDVVVVLLTGFIDQERLDRMMSAGIAGFLRRPLKTQELLAHIKAVLESVKLSRAGCVASCY